MKRTAALVLTVALVAGVAYARDLYIDRIRVTQVCAKDGTGCVSTPVNSPTQVNTASYCGSSGQQCVPGPLPFFQWGQNAEVSGAFDAGLTGFASDGGLVACNCTLSAIDAGEAVACNAVGGVWVVGKSNNAGSTSTINWRCSGYGQ